MSSIPHVSEMITSDRLNTISLDFVKQEPNEKPGIEDESASDECISEKFQNLTEESDDNSDKLIDINGKGCTRKELLEICISNEFLKYEENYSNDGESQNQTPLLDHYQEDFISASMPKKESESIHIEDNKAIVNHFIDNEGNICKNDTWQCITGVFVKHEEHDSSNEQLPKRAKVLFDDQENFVDTLIPKQESEFIDIEEAKMIVNHSINDEENICNNDIGEGYTDTIECKKTGDFVAENESTCSFSKLETQYYVKEQIEDRVIDLKQKTHKCLLCSYGAFLKINLQKHVDSVHLKLMEHKCHLCDYSTSRKTYIWRHIDSVHKKLKKHKCHLCDYATSDKSYIQRHIHAIHLKLKNHKCHLCDYTASHNSVIQKHIDCVHLKLKNHKCHLCDYTASQKSFIQRHVDSVHLNLKNHKCHLCDYTASHNSVIQKHIDCVHLKLKNHKCHLCDYTASQKSFIQRHVDSVHLNLKNHKCQFCDYMVKKSSLQLHIDSVHLKLKDHKCHLCDYTSSKKSRLQKHLDHVHLKLKNHK